MLFPLPGLPFPLSPGYFLHTLQDLAPPGIFPEPLAAAAGQGALLGVPSKGYISVSPYATPLHSNYLFPCLFPF